MTIEVLTSITSDKDILRNDQAFGGATWTAYTDKPYTDSKWALKTAPSLFVDPRRNSRLPKILSHQYSDAEYQIWIDGNVTLLVPPEEMIDRYLQGYDFALYHHRSRDCIYEEATICAVRHLDDPETIIEQVVKYEQRGFPKHYGIGECNVLLRRNTSKVQEFNNAWWSEYCRHSRRDQISFAYASKLVGMPYKLIKEDWLMRPDTSAVRSDNCVDILGHKHSV